MAIPCSPRLPVAAIVTLLLCMALPAVSHAHGGEVHGDRHEEKSEASATEIPAETVTPVPVKPTASTSSTPPAETAAAELPAAPLLEGGEIVGALIFTAPFALTFLKRRTQAKTSLR